jgi:hypothetical protein
MYDWLTQELVEETEEALDGSLAPLLASIVGSKPSVDGNEGLTAQAVARYFEVLRLVDDLADAKLSLTYDDNTVEKGTTTRVIVGRVRAT